MVIRSPSPEVEIPDAHLTPFVLQRERELKDHTAIVNGATGEVISYAELGASIRRAASGFAALGVGIGDVVALYAPNSPDYIIAFHAISYIGGTVTTVNPLYNCEELMRQISDSGAKVVVTIPELLNNLPASEYPNTIGDIVVFGQAGNAISFSQLLNHKELAEPVEVDVDTHVVALPYSSGTTGLPKGVMITHKNLVANVCQIAGIDGYLETDENDIQIAVLPFFHIYGMNIFMCFALCRGATVITMPRFDLEQFLTLIQQHKATRTYIAPPIAVALAKHPLVDQFQLSSLKMMLSGAAPLGSEVTQEVESRIGCDVVQGYGLTETSPVTNVCPNAAGKKKYGSIGPPICNTEMKVIDLESGDSLDRNQRGEVCIRGPQVMRGYLHNSKATHACIDSDGWFHTGDVGYADDDGYFYIVDRVKELIKYKGYQVAPAELEALLLTHPEITDVAVIGAPDQECGELPMAFVVQKGEVNADEIIEFVASRVAPYKKIRIVELIEAVPKAPSGKILRRILRDQLPKSD